ncbi:MAG: ABC transporter ATP-binding protein [Gammaproteobacteria bacterium]|nr:ABC transporter ATP-binding protein [Gammaproteobacteria bacterium]
MSHLLETQHLHIRIADQVVCNDLNLQMQSGEIWGVLGPNGSGKTTLLHTFARLRKAAHGEILLQGKKLADLSTKAVAQNIGVLFQNTENGFDQTVFEFCLAGRHPHLSRFAFEGADDRERVMRALIATDLDKKSAQKVSTLSGGEKRRLSLATLLTQAPRVYILDEPTNHLDIQHQIQIMQHLQQLAAQHHTGIIMSLHDLNMAEHYCQRILLLFGDGETIQGTPREILTPNHLTRLFRYPIEQIDINQQRRWLPHL